MRCAKLTFLEYFPQISIQRSSLLRRYIPTRTLRGVKGSHPWLDERCRAAIRPKQAREGSPQYKDACELCTHTLRVAYAGYVHTIRKELRTLPKGSKKWWALSKTLMDNAPSKAGMPTLRNPAGELIHDGQGKAELFAKALSSKFVLPDAVEGDPDLNETPSTMMSDFDSTRPMACKLEAAQNLPIV